MQDTQFKTLCAFPQNLEMQNWHFRKSRKSKIRHFREIQKCKNNPSERSKNEKQAFPQNLEMQNK
jgi:hypothetical protein